VAFNSIHFLIFFPIVLTVYWGLRRSTTARQVFLLAASYYFYMSWSVTYGLLMLLMTAVDFVVAGRIAASTAQRTRRTWLLLSLTSNLGMLFLFKYYNFFMDNLDVVVSAGGGQTGFFHHALILPLGISFFTFEALSYTIDVYRGALAPTRSFLRFCLFISFFPRLVAGPIIRASHFLPQLEAAPRFDDRAAEAGLGRIVLGLFKKMCIADVLGVTLVDPAFADPSGCSSWMLLIAMYGYAFQIYYDFSGYSDIAIGAAKMLGFDLPINFNRPYLATSMRDFWRRWHISLSTWLRDYLYVPLGGGHGTAWKTARNLGVVMLLGGLWHGAAWGFVVWGAVHGLLLAAGRLFHAATGINADAQDQPLPARLARIVLTFHLAAGCFVMFRAPDFTTLSGYFASLVRPPAGGNTVPSIAYAALAVVALLEWTPSRWMDRLGRVYSSLPCPVQGGVVGASLITFGALGGASVPFIYFQF